ncbi:MAG TPA: hypothetical protein VFI62_05000, partial [Burkholderiales bacterium]|nr:hypothetical protein [Burkholderiales bacterium]
CKPHQHGACALLTRDLFAREHLLEEVDEDRTIARSVLCGRRPLASPPSELQLLAQFGNAVGSCCRSACGRVGSPASHVQ